jgi:DNA-binding GntR family transcriptional regulator
VSAAADTPALERLCLSDRIREIVLTRILDGTYAAGTQLKELVLAEEFQSSQTPVREALRELEVIGLVQIQRFRGTWVRGADAADLADAYELRATLEERAAQIAVPCGAEDLLALDHALADLTRAATGHDPIGYSHAIQAFHRRIILMSSNREFLRVWDSQHWAVRTRIAAERVRDRLPQFIAGHTKALEALTAGDGISAGQQLRLLISSFLHAGGALTHAAPGPQQGE